MSRSIDDNKAAADVAALQLHAFGLVCEVEHSTHTEAGARWQVARWRVAVRMPQRQRFEIALRVDGVWVVLSDASKPNAWRDLRGAEFPTLQQAVTHYLLTVTQ